MLNGVASSTSLLLLGACILCLPSCKATVGWNVVVAQQLLFLSLYETCKMKNEEQRDCQAYICSILQLWQQNLRTQRAFPRHCSVCLGSQLTQGFRGLCSKNDYRCGVDGSPPFSIQRRVGQRGEITRTPEFQRMPRRNGNCFSHFSNESIGVCDKCWLTFAMQAIGWNVWDLRPNWLSWRGP